MRIIKYTESRITYVCLITDKDINKYYDPRVITMFKDELIALNKKKCKIYSSVLRGSYLSELSPIKRRYYTEDDINKEEIRFEITIKPQDYESMEAYYRDVKKLSEECIDILEQIKNEILIRKYL